MKHSITILAALLLLAVATVAHADALKANLSAEVVFEEDFESPEDYQKRWQAPSGWSLVESEINGRKTTVLNIKGGNEGLSVPAGLGDFDYEADVLCKNSSVAKLLLLLVLHFKYSAEIGHNSWFQHASKMRQSPVVNHL